ncbi:hypothetical protein OHU17_28375 [Streptomyces goshikiensis]|uniref:Uncharacterized protein n=1 Tax=Streptomyces goshikiensis TaxID=1942 RepID=A0ABZ1RRE7_9ACTN|nr:hypothetical protein [Streptomyces goshikiensis]
MGAAMRSETESGRAAARALLGGAHAGFGGVRPPDLPGAWTAFDEEVRRVHSRSYPPPPGTRLETRLCDPDGHVREAALRDPKAPLPLVAIRCADWVPAVRDLARQVLAGALAADPGRTLTALVPLVLRLGRREQGAGRWSCSTPRCARRSRSSPRGPARRAPRAGGAPSGPRAP